MFLWDFVADKVMGQIVDWIYSKLLEFLGEFFGMMGSMGADLFDYDFVRAIIELFRLLDGRCLFQEWSLQYLKLPLNIKVVVAVSKMPVLML